MWELLEAAAVDLIADAGLQRVDDVDTVAANGRRVVDQRHARRSRLPLGEQWPDCADELTPEMRYGDGVDGRSLRPDGAGEDRAAADGAQRGDGRDLRPARLDFVITASNPDVAFSAEGPLPDMFGGVNAGAGNNGRLTFPANLHGNPAISIPAGSLDGLPVGLQVVGRHFTEQLLLDLALLAERNRPWPLVAPGSPR